ncbi:MAG: chromosome segregation protein SMC [Pseudomonadota bacterium]
MHITKLRLIGFKSFVEPTELLIEPGLTGVVGPNGCGKSNLLEALRWVMGETSYKSMRASAMDDVIFSGTTGRPPRNMAEVTIFLDNQDRVAPAEFNDNDHIEITRRIEREAGSAYRVNNRDVRARDIKILFEDAATGARSPALVRQGQIGEIVNAKPEQRRRILEDAAGTAGLHSRRHEAELRLKAAENNLTRIGDVLGQLKSQIESLKRQARQARRYSELSEEIRKGEALRLYLVWSEAQVQVDHDEAALQVALEALGAATTKEAAAIRLEAEFGETLHPLRDEEVTRAAVLARLRHEQTNLDNDVRRAKQRDEELTARIGVIETDISRETDLVEEAQKLSQSLASELEVLEGEIKEASTAYQSLRSSCEEAAAELSKVEAQLSDVMTRQSEARAKRSSAEAECRERTAQVHRVKQQQDQIVAQLKTAAAAAPDAKQLNELKEQAVELAGTVEKLIDRQAQAEKRIADCREKLEGANSQAGQARITLKQVETERDTLAKLLQSSDADGVEPVVEQIKVAKGYEVALGAALGDDLELPIGVEGRMHWKVASSDGEDAYDDDYALPNGLKCLADFVEAPAELQRRLRQVGVVEPELGQDLQAQLRPGQRLVSTDGDLWRWDGLVAPADAPTPAAQRLAARNRLEELISEQADAVMAVAEAEQLVASLTGALKSASDDLNALRAEHRRVEVELGKTNKQLTQMERAAQEAEVRLAALRDTEQSAAQEFELASKALSDSEDALKKLAATDDLDSEVAGARESVQQARAKSTQLQTELTVLERAGQQRQAQQTKLVADVKRWTERSDQGLQQLKTLQQRLTENRDEKASVAKVPGQLEERRSKLMNELTQAEAERRAAADRLAEAEAGLKEANATLRAAQGDVSEQREIRARADAKLESARARRADIVRQIQENFETQPEGCLALAELESDDKLPSLSDADARLLRLKTDRERLGGVNLQATTELEELNTQFGTLDGERADVEEAIAKLRGGIASLNREGRKRLREAFETVNGHFQSLFTTLFGGGEAKLEMIDDSEDPLAGGLEIIAKPPGKKPTTLSLLSGGEQTLTALSLIFAVFLTNPSPICVLDEVDAPLDDANVDRFCTLMEKMASETDTRFLVITHHPMTMARVDRLFGVTMVERGVSQLVSVDLAVAEEFLEAG